MSAPHFSVFGRGTAYSRVNSGDLLSVRFGRVVRIPREALRAMTVPKVGAA
jgi:hypothetical protein